MAEKKETRTRRPAPAAAADPPLLERAPPPLTDATALPPEPGLAAAEPTTAGGKSVGRSRPARLAAAVEGIAPAPAPPPAKPARGRGKRESYQETRDRRRRERETDELTRDLRAYAQARPSGWGHDDWLTFLDSLKERGHDTSDPDRIGRALEHERLAVVLGEVPGLGPRRVESLVARFDTLWSMRQASAEEVAAVGGMNRPLAERVVEHLRSRYV